MDSFSFPLSHLFYILASNMTADLLPLVVIWLYETYPHLYIYEYLYIHKKRLIRIDFLYILT